MKELLAFIQETYTQQLFTSSDRKQLKSLLQEKNIDAHQLNVIRSKIYDWIREGNSDPEVLKLMNWLEDINKCLLPSIRGNEVAENRTYFSPGNDCENAIIQLIKSARESVKVCVFTISENEITDEIIAAHKRGISVKVVTDNDKLDDRGSDIRLIADAGIVVKIDTADSHMHHKFCVIDKTTLMTGSYNWTKSAAHRNQENLLVTEDEKTVKAYLGEFEKLWDKYPQF